MMPGRFLPMWPLAGVLVGCGVPVPNGVNLNVSGEYVGRVWGLGGERPLKVTVQEEETLDVTVTFKDAATGEVFTLQGLRSGHGATPVQVNVTGYAGSGSVCKSGATDYYTSALSFYASQPGKARGNLYRESCDSGSKEFRPNTRGAGYLELSRP